MKRVLPLLLASALAGCPQPEPAPEPAPAAEPAPAPAGIEAPVDAWKEAVAARLPAPWRLTQVEAQVDAPPGWTRIRGDRGLLLGVSGGDARQSFWVMARGFEGRPLDGEPAARVVAGDPRFFLYAPPEDAPGWTHTAEFIKALEMTPQE